MTPIGASKKINVQRYRKNKTGPWEQKLKYWHMDAWKWESSKGEWGPRIPKVVALVEPGQ